MDFKKGTSQEYLEEYIKADFSIPKKDKSKMLEIILAVAETTEGVLVKDGADKAKKWIYSAINTNHPEHLEYIIATLRLYWEHSEEVLGVDSQPN